MYFERKLRPNKMKAEAVLFVFAALLLPVGKQPLPQHWYHPFKIVKLPLYQNLKSD